MQKSKRVNKEEWVELFRDIGLSDDQMTTWHQLFEERYPESHENFLGWIGLSADEIADVRANNRK